MSCPVGFSGGEDKVGNYSGFTTQIIGWFQTTPLTGQYKINDVALSLPSIIGVNGVENRLVEYLSDDEYKALQVSSKKMKETIASIKI